VQYGTNSGCCQTRSAKSDERAGCVSKCKLTKRCTYSHCFWMSDLCSFKVALVASVTRCPPTKRGVFEANVVRPVDQDRRLVDRSTGRYPPAPAPRGR
jgi:hypothetical protein